MKLLIVTKGLRYHRFFAPVVSALIERADDVRIALVAPDADNFSRMATSLPYELQKMVDPGSFSTRLLRRLRPLLAYFNWLLLDVQSEVILEKKSQKFLSSSLGSLASIIKPQYLRRAARFLRALRSNRFVAGRGLELLRFMERILPLDRNVSIQIRDIAPDVILVTPAIHWRSFEMDYVRAGLRWGIPTVTLIGSWDHLTTKGLLSVVSDQILVWNEDQVAELRQYHFVPPDHAVAVGAVTFDQVFEEHPLQPYPEFCKYAELDVDRPFVLWAASTLSGADDEKVILRRLIDEMRAYPVLKDFQVLIRPHPKAVQVWDQWNVEGAHVWPSADFMDEKKIFYGLYNSITYATAVVGLSTSLFIETAILDRPCALLETSLADMHAPYNKFIHFNYWLKNSFPVATRDETDCARWLAQVAEEGDDGRKARRRFVKAFIRPQGIDRPAADAAADVILDFAASRRL